MAIMKSKRNASFAASIVTGLVATIAAGAPQPAAGQANVKGRGIFEAGQDAGVRYNILRERNGVLRRVSTTSDFRSGDRFKIEVETNRSSFLYVLNRTLPGHPDRVRNRGIEEIGDDDRRDRTGSRRKYRLIYPSGRTQPAAVPPHRRVLLPPGANRYFVMDDEPGLEKVYIMASEERIDVSDYFDLENGRQRTGRRPGSRPGGGGSPEDDVLDQLNTWLAAGAGNASTYLADSDAAERGIDVSGYGIVRDDRRAGTVELSLRHLP